MIRSEFSLPLPQVLRIKLSVLANMRQLKQMLPNYLPGNTNSKKHVSENIPLPKKLRNF